MTAAGRERLLLIGCGAVMRDVAALLEQAGLRAQVHAVQPAAPPDTAALQDLLERAGVTAAAAVFDRPMPRVASALNAAAQRRDTPFTLGVVEETMIRIGPSVWPGRTACYECFRTRYLTHSPNRRAEVPLERFYDDHPDWTPRGRLGALDRLAAALIATEVERLLRGEPPVRARYLTLDPFTGQHGRHAVTPVGWCAACSRVRAPQEWSSEALAPAVGALLAGEGRHVQG